MGSQLYIFVNTRCTETQWLQLHEILPLPLRQEGIHNDGRPWHLWAQLHRQSLFGICASKSGSRWMNLSSCWPTTVWLQLQLHQYQLIVACCNLFSCNGAIVLCMCCHVTIIVAITVIMLVKWHWHLDAFNSLTMLIVALGSRWAFALA
jgi:hypothetical protein